MKKTITSLVTLAIVLPMLFSSCATIFGKSSYPVAVDSNPSGAGFFSKAEYQVKVSLNGYAEQIIPVNYKLNVGTLVIY